MQENLSDRDIHNLGSKFDVQIREEASYLLWYILRQTNSSYAKLQDCITALSEDNDLFEALKNAHVGGDYGLIRRWEKCSIRRHISQDTIMEHNIRDILLEIQPIMKKLVMGDIILPAWSPPEGTVKREIAEHLSLLKIPCLKGKPNLLLHDLGSFTCDVRLEKRLKNIFMANNHTFLVNTSGSGKTRLLLEGLCENWGFYFTSLVDSSLLGSSDVLNGIHKHVPDAHHFRRVLPPMGSPGYDTALKANRDVANRVFRQIFLARLIIFNVFAETMIDYVETNDAAPRDPRIYKTRWLLLQLQPSFVHPQMWDVFDQLASKLSDASDSFINHRTRTLLTNLRSLCAQLQADASATTAAPITTAEAIQTPLFCVLDEAQHAATQHSSSFRSDHNGSHRPILREIVKAWEGQTFGQGVFMVVAGTGISKDVVDQAMASAIMKDSKYRWCSDTGAFDSKIVQEDYLRKYLPKTLLASKTGERLLERVWHWLHGRYRFTTGYVSELLFNGFKRPHGLLNAYIQHFTNFTVTDASHLVKMEGSEALPTLSQYCLDFSKLKKNSDMLSTIHQLTTHYLMRAVLPTTLGKDEAIYVEYGFARFVDADTKTVTVDEPLVLLAATYWINLNHQSSYKHFAKQIHLHDPHSNGFENYIAYCLDMIFSTRRCVNDVFDFTGTPPIWSTLDAELVALHRIDASNGIGSVEESLVRHYRATGPSLTLGTNAKSPTESLSWLAHQMNTPICFPHSAMGPDLLFVLRLSDHSLIWVAVQTKYSFRKRKEQMLARSDLRRAVRSVTPSLFFVDKEGHQFSPTSHPTLLSDTARHLLALPRRRTDAGRFSLLRVVASFPADTNLKRCTEEDPDADGHPIASLNMALLMQVTKRLPPVDFLQGLRGTQQESGSQKRKRGVTTTKRRTKIKLN